MMQGFGAARQNNTVEEIVEAIKNKKTFVILVPEKAVQDTVAAALGLYFALLKLGKDAYVVSSQKVNYQLPGMEKIQTSLSIKGDSLKISFPYQEGSVDKVDWEIEDGRFNIIITPVQGYPKLDPSKVEFSYTGGAADCFMVLGAVTLNSLGRVYTENKEAFQGEIINIDRQFANSRFGTLNYVNTTLSSLSEAVFKIIKKLEVELDQEIATNLYAGLLSATNNFTSYNVKPETLEMAAALLRAGAKKIPAVSAQPKPIRSTFQPSPSVVRPKPITFQAPKPKPKEESETTSSTTPQPEKKTTPPQDWLKPKIFSGKKIG